MNKDIQEIRRLAGILDEDTTFSAASLEQLEEFLTEEIEFLGKLTQVIDAELPQSSRGRILTVLQHRSRALEQYKRNVVGPAKRKQKAYADADAAELGSRSYGSV